MEIYVDEREGNKKTFKGHLQMNDCRSMTAILVEFDFVMYMYVLETV